MAYRYRVHLRRAGRVVGTLGPFESKALATTQARQAKWPLYTAFNPQPGKKRIVQKACFFQEIN